MCRIAAYLGNPLPLSALFDEPSHGLIDQGRNARRMTDSSVAGDGWGVGWFAPGVEATPGLLKNILPIWSDQNARTALPAITSGSFVGHIRLASPGIETCLTNTPIYVLDDHLWTINGSLEPWPGPLSKAIRDRLDPDHEADIRGSTDGELMGALWRTHFRRTGGKDAAAALRSTIREARDMALDHGGGIKTNIILASAAELLAARFAEPGDSNTLFTFADQTRWRGGSVVASEPLDDGPGWCEVDEATLVRVDRRGVRFEPLDLDGARSAEHRRIA